MTQPRIGRRTSGLTTVDRTRTRQTPRPALTFKNVMLGGAQVLLSGARVATRIVGGPLLSAAVSGGDGSSGVLEGGTGGSGNGEVDALQSYQDQKFGDDLKLLALQEKIQSNNRKITLISNVMKTRHDTEKSAISNIRS